MKMIKVGDSIVVDKGMLGSDFGILKSIDGYSMGAFFGTYETNGKDGLETKGFDQSVHKISLDMPAKAGKELKL